MTMRIGIYGMLAGLAFAAATVSAWGNETPELVPVTQRFASADVQEEPNFQRHVSPLFGRLGCNGRSCHGSFQGRGGFRLSLFGYDFKADHEALLAADSPRVDVKNPLESLILSKPTDADMHEGGQRYKKDTWQYHVFRRWIEAGAKYSDEEHQKLVRLEVTPPELQFSKSGETAQLKAVAVWPDGTREDVTPLCRFHSNSDQVAKITDTGLVTATDQGDTHLVVFYDNAVVPIPVIRPVSDKVGDKYPQVATNNKVDELVLDKLRKLGVVPSDLCTDAEFLRRVYLDLTGTLPTAAEVEAFLTDESPSKRSAKIDELLATPAYVAWWTTKLCDITGNNDRQLNQVNQGLQGSASQGWYDWIYKRVEENVPYDQIAEGIVVSKSRRDGQSYADYCKEMSDIYHPDSDKKMADRPTMPYYWARTNLRQPEERAIGFAYTFLGIRIQCAQCHKHPFDQWSKSDFDAFKGFFPSVTVGVTGARDKESQEQYRQILAELGIEPGKRMNGNEIRRMYAEKIKEGKTIPFAEVYVNQQQPNPNRRPNNNRRNQPVSVPSARVLGGDSLDLTKTDDARKLLMEWLRSKENPYFAPAFVNRVWASYFNVGIVQPPDDMSLANPPSNKPLLDYLAQGFNEHGFDMKWVHREILNSRSYQLSWQPNETNAKDERNFSRAVPRRLPAEVAYDAIQMATASDAKAATMLTDVKNRAIGIPAANARGGQGTTGFALQIFGRSIRESNCDCDRSMEASLLQTVFLQNDFQVLSAISGGRDTWIDQISRQLLGVPAQGNAPQGNDQNRRRDIAQLEQRLKRAKESGDEQQVQRIESRLAQLQPGRKAEDKKPAEPGSPEQSAKLVKQAYLRTLSRYPTAEEMDRCHQFLASSANPVEGAKGLLWTLVNTKEFIVNH
jgi:hypothetical protein